MKLKVLKYRSFMWQSALKLVQFSSNNVIDSNIKQTSGLFKIKDSTNYQNTQSYQFLCNYLRSSK